MDASLYTYSSPMKGYENAVPLPDEIAEDGKSYKNTETGKLSSSYDKFTDPLRRDRRGGFDIHVYYLQSSEKQLKYAHELWERIRHEFPELRIYKFWEKPVGPHPTAMFEVNLFTPAQFGAFIPWINIWRGPLSVLVHPNTEPEPGQDHLEAEKRDHTSRAIWLGEKIPLDLSLFNSKRVDRPRAS
ncbi:hypothetical protein MKZ38_001484 [Zalerion maritima]|uniref:DOPA 4,5-dioxygenase n=1 Tax=Zalerion maritima TaxID=339359 RepID=A0AAD5WXI2_9PEZI|nr:hypothetical protein MKZ38_001484 [Zalerion maritima]